MAGLVKLCEYTICLLVCRRRAWVVQGLPPKEGPWAQRPVNFILSGSACGCGIIMGLRFLFRFRWVDLLAASPPSLDVLVVLFVWLAMSEVRMRSVVISVMIGQMSAVRRGTIAGVFRMLVGGICLALGLVRYWVWFPSCWESVEPFVYK